ncbi:MAG: alpha/beta fold hydrolase [Saprospiraceae bacterium]|nr:alpha/beta fold hydrolase [Saprospiraceae bacterium]
MPIIHTPPIPYKHPKRLFNRHIETIYPSRFRKIIGVDYERERMETADGDFIDLDWLIAKEQNNSLMIMSHGLEGSSASQYAKGTARIFYQHGWDALVWNYRSCSGEINLKIHSYHSGATSDLQEVLNHVWQTKNYHNIVLIGHSLGGNLTLKYLGEHGKDIHPNIRCALAFCAPVHLKTCSRQMEKWFNVLYQNMFVNSLKRKVTLRAQKHPSLDTSKLKDIKTLREFDEHYTAPIHGFAGADDYYARCSALQFLPQINIPTLIVNSKNDPFLTTQSFPYDLAQNSSNVYLEVPKHGGHCGFTLFNKENYHWSEKRSLDFALRNTRN